MSHDLRCLACKSDDVQGVPALVASGRWSFQVRLDQLQLSSASVMNLINGAAKAGNELAEQLAPPREPKKKAPRSLITAAVALPPLFASIPLLMTRRYGGGELQGLVALTAVTVICFALLIRAELKTRDEAYEKEHLAWHQALERWSRLVYCARCGRVTDRESGHIALPNGVQSFVYAEQEPGPTFVPVVRA